MGNNLCYSKSGMHHTMSQLLCQQKLNECDIILTAGNIENESVECIVQPTDQQFSNIPQNDKPTFIPTNGNCIFVGSIQKNKKNYILAVVQDINEISIYDQQDEERQLMYETIQNCLKMANSRQIRSIAFPVFQQKDHTTSATIMIMAIKLYITEQKSNTVTKICISLNVRNLILIDLFTFSKQNRWLVLSGYFNKYLNNTTQQNPNHTLVQLILCLWRNINLQGQSNNQLSKKELLDMGEMKLDIIYKKK